MMESMYRDLYLNENIPLSESVRRIFIYVNPSRPNTELYVKQTVQALTELGMETWVYSVMEPSRAGITEFVEKNLRIAECDNVSFYKDTASGRIFDMVVTLGGDGTLLKYISHSPFLGVPILPINAGSLGYITSFSARDLVQELGRIMNGHHIVSHRTLLESVIKGSEMRPYFAFNEFVIGAGQIGRIAEMELTIMNTTFPLQADGVIIATPSGSTAYSLAAGGPILYAEMAAIVITPICPFSLATRPIVIPSRHVIQITVPKSQVLPLALAIDGWGLAHLESGQVLEVREGPQPLPLIALTHKSNYFDHMREKLGWRGNGKPK